MTDTRSWWPEGYGEDPAFQVRRIIYGTVTGGDYVRGSTVLTLPHTALRFPTFIAGAAEAVGRAILHVRVKSHYIREESILSASGVVQRTIQWPCGDIEVTWGWPASIEDTWTEVALVRSAFGRPSTVNDGQTAMRGRKEAFYRRNQANEIVYEDGKPVLAIPPVFTDEQLPTGRWYHYGLFFKVSEVEWIQGMLDSCLLPRDFHHADHLYTNVPPYYRWTDENGLVGRGYLQRFLEVFGFELDTCREFIESWQHVYDADWSPIRLLRKLGDNFGYPYEQGVGDIRYRSLFSTLGHLHEIRGTQKCLELVVQRMSKFNCDLTAGGNMMLLPDDSDFYTGTGNWGVPLAVTDAPGSYLGNDNVTLTVNSLSVQPPPPGIGRRSMRITSPKATAAMDIGIACGDSYVPIAGGFKEVTPQQGGIPVDPALSYGFSVWIYSVIIPTSVQLSLLWFDSTGGLLSATSGALTVISPAATWEEYIIGPIAAPPAGAFYVVPYILFDLRTDDAAYTTSSPPIDIAGAMVYSSPTIGEALGPPPNQYLTVGDPGEPLGARLNFKGTLTGASTTLPTGAAADDAYVLLSPVPTSSPRYYGITPDRAAAANDAIYWNGSAWVNIGPKPATWEPFLLGSPEDI